jgi:hypothetical protein
MSFCNKRFFVFCLTGYFIVSFSLSTFGQFTRAVPGKFTDMVYSSANNKIYAAGFEDPLGAPMNPYLGVIDPQSATVELKIPFTQIIPKLALSDDQSVLYCVSGDSIHRYNFALGAFDQHFGNQFPSDGLGPHFVGDIIVLPGQPDKIIIGWVLNNFESKNVIGFYDNGELQSATSTNVFQYENLTTDGTFMYGYELFQGTLRPSTISGNGLLPLTNTYAYNAGTIRYFDGRLYGSNGSVINIGNNGQLNKIGQFQTRPGRSTVMPYLPGSDTIYMHTFDGFDVYLQKFDRDNFQLLSEDLLGTLKSPYLPDRVTPLGNPSVVAVLSLFVIQIIDRCVAQITSVPNLDKPIYHTCINTPDTLRITAPGAFPDDQYYWSNGDRGKTIAIPSSNYAITTLSYQVADQNGCLSPASTPIEIQQAYALPPVEIGAAAGGVICQGGFLDLEAIGFQGDYLINYLWSNGMTGKKIRIETPGNFFCRALTPQGCLSPPNPWPFTAVMQTSAAPATPQISIIGNGDGDEIICSTDSAKISAPVGYNLYFWSDDLTIYQVSTRNLPSTDRPIWVQVSNSVGCLSERSNVLNLQRYPSPPKPTIQRSNSLLASSATQGNQWFFNGNPIAGATEQYITVAQAGSYTVQVTLQSGCPSVMSESFEYIP